MTPERITLDRTQDAMALASAVIEPFNRRDFDALIAMADGAVNYADIPLGLHITDADEFRAHMQSWVDAFSDLKCTVTSAAQEGDLLAYEARFEGTHDGPLPTPMGVIPASGRRVSVLITQFIEFDGARVAAVRSYGDTLSLLAQVGAIPSQSSAAAEAGQPTASR
jgi:steroid delta-isomerase-like uncharacterized protein